MGPRGSPAAGDILEGTEIVVEGEEGGYAEGCSEGVAGGVS